MTNDYITIMTLCTRAYPTRVPIQYTLVRFAHAVAIAPVFNTGAVVVARVWFITGAYILTIYQ